MDPLAHGDDWVERASGLVILCAAMLGATLAGQLIGIAVDAFVGTRLPFLPVAFSIALEGLVGARVGALRAGRALTRRESARTSVAYSIGLVALSVPLVVWVRLSEASGGVATAPWAPGRLLVVPPLLVAWTAARAGVMILAAPRGT